MAVIEPGGRTGVALSRDLAIGILEDITVCALEHSGSAPPRLSRPHAPPRPSPRPAGFDADECDGQDRSENAWKRPMGVRAAADTGDERNQGGGLTDSMILRTGLFADDAVGNRATIIG